MERCGEPQRHPPPWGPTAPHRQGMQVRADNVIDLPAKGRKDRHGHGEGPGLGWLGMGCRTRGMGSHSSVAALGEDS